MKISQLKVLILQLLLIDPTHLQNVTIHRLIERNKWKDVKDAFDIPQSVCQQRESAFGDYCTRSSDICQLGGTSSSHSYSCTCPETNATLTLRDNLWRCQENTEVRKQLGCGINYSLFDDEEDDDELRTLNINRWRRTKINKRSCALNFDLSWYIGCDAKTEPLTAGYNSSFRLGWFSGRYFIRVSNDSFQGVVVNLGLRCTDGSYRNGCFIFKVEGTLTCPIVPPQLNGFPSMIIPTATSSFSKKTIIEPRGTTTMTSAKPGQSPSQDRSRPSSGIEQRSDDQHSSPVGVIAGVTVSIATVLLVITGVFCYRRRKSRKGTDANKLPAHQVKTKKLGKSSQMNGGFNPDVKNVNVHSSIKETGDLYASLSVPEGNNIYGHGNTQDPVYNVLEDPSSENDKEGEYYGSLSMDQPVYNVLEDLSVGKQGSVENEEYGEVDPVYNVLDDPYYDGAGRTEHYGSAPVNEPFYNTLEESHANGEGIRDAKDEPVYNTLEEPCPMDVEEDSGYASAAARRPWQ